jgi:hypothetical protein
VCCNLLSLPAVFVYVDGAFVDDTCVAAEGIDPPELCESRCECFCQLVIVCDVALHKRERDSGLIGHPVAMGPGEIESNHGPPALNQQFCQCRADARLITLD